MLDAGHFNAALKNAGVTFFTGVPCSLLGAAMQDVVAHHRYVGATSEGEALAIAAGNYLAGGVPAVFLQNSGLGNLVNPLTSLSMPFAIPSLLIIGWRGMPGKPDEPQHTMMGAITPPLLDLMNVTYQYLPDTDHAAAATAKTAIETMLTTQRPVALLVKPDTFAPSQEVESVLKVATLTPPTNTLQDKVLTTDTEKPPTRFDVLKQLVHCTPNNAAIIATTGKCGRELFTIKDCVQHLYMVGAMGSASAVGLGVALEKTSPVIVLDGDGAALMRLGTFATIGHTAPANMIHVVLDNGVHDSTGGQATGAETIDFCAAASACSYKTSARATSVSAFETMLQAACYTVGPHFIHVRIAPGSCPQLARPDLAPHTIARRFADYLKTLS